MPLRSIARVLGVVAAALCAVPPARAQPAAAIAKVTQLNREALAAVDKREFEKARGLLRRALDLCDDASLDRHPVAARTHVHMGVVIIRGFKNYDLGRKQFAKALEIEPGISVTKSLSTPELEEAFAEAKGEDEANDGDGQPVAQRGSEQPPLVLSFAATPARKPPARAEAVAAQNQIRRSGDEQEEDDDEEAGGKVFVALLVGSGLGYTSGMGEVNADTPVAGTVSGALLGHVAPEVGYWVTPDLLLSLQGRLQLVSGPTEVSAGGRTYSPVPAAIAAFAKATWLMGSGNLRPFVSGAVGGGQIRHVVTFAKLTDCGAGGNQRCVDSVVAGPLLGAVGGGLMYRLATSVALVVGTTLEVAAPKFTLNLDVNGGIAFTF